MDFNPNSYGDEGFISGPLPGLRLTAVSDPEGNPDLVMNIE